MSDEDLIRHGEMTRACIDSLSSLSREEQATLLARLLDRHDEPAFRTLLDQLSDDELARWPTTSTPGPTPPVGK